MSDLDPDPAALGARDGVVHRRRTDELAPDAFERACERVRSGLSWGVGALVRDEGDLLLVREDGRWLLPGGEVEAGESHAAALVREVREETGLVVEPGDLRAVTEVRLVRADRADGPDGVTSGVADPAYAFATYEATLVEAHPTVTDDPGLEDEAIEAVEWFAPADLPDETLDRGLVLSLVSDA